MVENRFEEGNYARARFPTTITDSRSGTTPDAGYFFLFFFIEFEYFLFIDDAIAGGQSMQICDLRVDICNSLSTITTTRDPAL